MRLTFSSVFFLYVGLAFGQVGTIMDAETGAPLSDVAIFSKDRSKIVLTDVLGNYNLDVFDKNEEITITLMGYETVQTNANKMARGGGRIYLISKPETLNEVVMSISKWEQQRKSIPQKISSIDARTVSFNNPQTTADLLQSSGKVFVQKSQLGGGSPMIRGFLPTGCSLWWTGCA